MTDRTTVSITHTDPTTGETVTTPPVDMDAFMAELPGMPDHPLPPYDGRHVHTMSVALTGGSQIVPERLRIGDEIELRVTGTVTAAKHQPADKKRPHGTLELIVTVQASVVGLAED